MSSLPTPSAPSGDLTAPSRRATELGHLQPFGLDVCASWREAREESSTSLNARALEELEVLRTEGRIILLSAPRAGHGKTHLVGRVARRLATEAVVATLPWQSAEDVTWQGCGRGVLHDLSGAESAPSLQTVCAGVMATLLRRLIQTGRIPSTDPVQALRVLSQDPMELFSEGGKARVIGEWFRRHFDPLRHPLAEISNADAPAFVEDWLRGFFDYVDDPSPAHLAALEGRVMQDSAHQVPRLLRLMSTWRPVVLVADHMDGLYRDPASGVAAARMTLALASMPGVHVVMSVNQDLWETTFGRQLPSALEDRLNAHNITLKGLNSSEARDLVTLRLHDLGVGLDDATDFLRFVDVDRFFLGRPIGSVSARGLLRHASQMWRIWVQMADAASTAGSSTESPEVEPEGFLMDSEPVPAAPALNANDQAEMEDVEKLAAHLAAEAGGKVVTLSGPVALPASSVAPPAPPLITPVAAPFSPPPAPQVTSPVTLTSLVPLGPSTPPSAPVKIDAPTPEPPDAVGPDVSDQVGSKPTALADAYPTTFHKLRQMLAKLKSNTESETLVAAEPASQAAAHRHTGTNGTNGTAVQSPGTGTLHARYEKFRQEIAGTPRSSSVEFTVIHDLVKLAGRRFPVVNYDEVDLPGLLGRSLPRWSLHGMELVFGLENFSDSRYWRTVSGYVAGRLAELQAATALGTGHPTQVKLVMFKGDMEAAALVSLLNEETIPSSLRASVDAVHLDPRSLASLYAMHRIIREAETGVLDADANAVLGALANELDFFWKRVTRPKG
jgi:hypothetical protein